MAKRKTRRPHALELQGLNGLGFPLTKALSSPGAFAVTAAANLAEARAFLETSRPDLVVAYMPLPDGLAIDLLAEVRKRYHDTDILIISVLGDETTILAAIAAGASGYILKDALPEDIHASALEVISGGSSISPTIARFIFTRLRTETAPPTADQTAPSPNLTTRELDILWGIAKGMTHNEIADQLGLSHHTVPSYSRAPRRRRLPPMVASTKVGPDTGVARLKPSRPLIGAT